MLEEPSERGASADASTAVATITAKRPAVRRGRKRAQGRRGHRIVTRALLTLMSLLMLAGVAASVIESGGETFSPIAGIGAIGQLPLTPQSFGDSAVYPPGADGPASGVVAHLSGQTHKPTPTPHSAVSGPAEDWSGAYSTSYMGSWSGGTGQGCPGGGAPAPRTNVIYNASSYGRARTNMVALTFDDGPTPFTSPPILSFLEQTHTPATFFVMGQYARAYPWLIKREAADGFAIGVHTWDHPDMVLLSPSARANELGSTIQQLHADLGSGFCAWLWRPPYGAVNSGIVAQADGFGLTTINWDVDPMDWSRPGTMVIVQRVLSQVRPGSIILMHDGPAARQQTAAALPYILAGLQQRGLVPVTVPTLLLGSESAVSGPTPTPAPTATVTVSPSPSPTVTATPTDTPTPISAPTDTPIPTTSLSGSSGWQVLASGDSFPSALGLWAWANTIPGYSGA